MPFLKGIHSWSQLSFVAYRWCPDWHKSWIFFICWRRGTGRGQACLHDSHPNESSRRTNL